MNSFLTCNLEIKTWINFGKLKSNGTDKLIKSRFLSSRSLFYSIDWLHEFKAVEVFINIYTLRDRTKHILLHFTEQERCHHIQLVQCLVKVLRDCNHHAKYHLIDHWREHRLAFDAIFFA